jgi:hypothetical protein
MAFVLVHPPPPLGGNEFLPLPHVVRNGALVPKTGRAVVVPSEIPGEDPQVVLVVVVVVVEAQMPHPVDPTPSLWVVVVVVGGGVVVSTLIYSCTNPEDATPPPCATPFPTVVGSVINFASILPV